MTDSKSPISRSQNGSDFFAAAAEMPKLKLDTEKATEKKATVAATVGFGARPATASTNATF